MICDSHRHTTWGRTPRTAGEQGAALPVVLVIVVVLTVVGIAMVDNALTEITIAGNQGFGVAALYLADAGIGDAVNRLRGNADLGQLVACAPGTLTFPAGSLESGIYEVCVQRVGTQRLIVATGRARASPADTTDAAEKTATHAVRVIPNSLGYAVFGYRNVHLFRQAGAGGTFFAPVVIQRFPAGRPMAVRGGPSGGPPGVIHVRLEGGAQVYGGLSSSGTYLLSAGAADPCLPVGSWTCEVNTGGPAFPTFNVRFSDPGPDATSYEGKARADTVGCNRLEGCYFASEAAFLGWVNACLAPKCTATATGRVIGPGVFFVNATTSINANADPAMDLREIIGTLVIGNGDLRVRAGFAQRPCTDAADPASCSEPALLVRGNLQVNVGPPGDPLNRQCRDLLIEGLQYVETGDFTMAFAPDPHPSQDCDPAPGRQPRTIVVRFGVIMAARDVVLDGAARVEYNPAVLDALPSGLLTWPLTAPVMMPVGWSSR